MEILYDKLVRDKIPEIIESKGDEPHYRVLSDEEYWQYLLKKDTEELEEVKAAAYIEDIKQELADKLELIRAMAEFNGLTLQDIINEADRKTETRGGFQKRLLLEKVVEKKSFKK